MKTRCNVLVVGAGPAGMAAAAPLAEGGLDVTVIDEQPAPGGQIWRGVEANAAAPIAGALGAEYRKGAQAAETFRSAGIDYRAQEQLWQLAPGWRGFTTRHGQAHAISADYVVLATGAQERPAPFPGWTLPGVMTVGAAQILLKTGGQIPQEPVWIAGSGPLVLLYITQLLALGGTVAGFIDTTPRGMTGRALANLGGAAAQWRRVLKGAGWLSALRRSGVPVHRGLEAIEALGTDRLESVRYRLAGGKDVTVPAGVLLVHEGLVPSIHATSALGCAHDWQPLQHSLAPRLDDWNMTTLDGLYVAGDGGGIAGSDAAILKGRLTAIGILLRLGRLDETEAGRRAAPLRAALSREIRFRRFLDAVYPPRPDIFTPPEHTIACRCEELTVGDIRATARACRGGPDQVKAQTRAGMGPCQGRQCGYTVSHIIAGEYGLTAQDVGIYRVRPPLKPIRIGELATLAEEVAGQ